MDSQEANVRKKTDWSPPKSATAVLEVNLSAIASNYIQLAAIARGAACAAVIKADAYGLGAIPVARRLFSSGCRNFFVATPAEGVALRKELSEPDIFILDGLLAGAEQLYHANRLIPVIGSLETLNLWLRFSDAVSTPLATAVHIDTGMNRLGVGPEEIPALVSNRDSYFNRLDMRLVVSHLACGDEPEHPRNRQQLERFQSILSELPTVRASLANSAGTLLGPDYHFDLVRPGIALYGGRAVNGWPNPMKPVIKLTSKILQVRTIQAGDSVGYGAAFVAQRETRIATIPIGYADGYFRALGSATNKSGAQVVILGQKAPVAGRISMDLLTVDVTELPAGLVIAGAPVEIIGEQSTVDDLADVSGTIGYEILTALGNRYERQYIGE